MNSRAWFGVNSHFEQESIQDQLINDLLKMYADALTQYFSIGDSHDYKIIEKIDKSKLPKDKKLFLEWFLEKGLPFLQNLAKMNIPDGKELSSKLEYDMYILEEEMDFQYPDDVRSTLIGIVNDLPDYIKAANEISVTVNSETLKGNWNKYLGDLNDVINTSSYHYSKEFYKNVSKYEESANYADSSFFI